MKIYLLLLSILLVGCDSQSNNNDITKNSILKPCPGFAETGYPPLVDAAECGQLLVNENPEDPQSKKIELNILRLPAISPVPEKDPLFLIQGGPGGSSVEMANHIHGAFWDVRKNRDLIFVDQRGTGKSNPLACDKLSDEQQKLSDAEQIRLMEIIYKDCAKKYESVATFYTTPYAVKDLDKVRIALGYEKINIWGGSYGTRVALEYSRRYPEFLRSMVLDGVAPVAISLPDFFARDAQAALKKLDENCNADSFCTQHYAPVMEKANQLLERLRAAEAAQAPLATRYLHPRYHQPAELHLTTRQFSNLVFSSLYSRELSALLPQVIHEAVLEQYQSLASINFLAEENMKKMTLSDAMRYSVICNEDRVYAKQKNIVIDEHFLNYDTDELKKICSFWPKADLPEEYFLPVKSDTPALLLSGGFDPVTPMGWAEEVAKQLPNSRSLLAKGGHHIVSYQGCIPQLIAQFIERASTDNIRMDCVDKIQALSPNLGANKSDDTQGGQP